MCMKSNKRSFVTISAELYDKVEKVSGETELSPYQIVRNAIEQYLDVNYNQYNSSYVVECISSSGDKFEINIDAPDKSYAIEKAKIILENKAYNLNEFIFKARKGMI